MNFRNIKWILYGLVAVYLIYNFAFGGSSSSEDYITEETVVPTEGLITTVAEVDSNDWKIKDEVTVTNPEDSRIIAEYMDGARDTFTLDEAKLVETQSTDNGSSVTRSIFRAASFGLFGYMLGRSMSSGPRPGAYMNQNTYNRVNNNAGSRMQSTAKRTTTTRPSGRSGYGGGSKSTRSYGG